MKTTEELIVAKYGLRVDMDGLAEILGLSKNYIKKLINLNEFKIETRRDGNRVTAHYADVAKYVDGENKYEPDEAV